MLARWPRAIVALLGLACAAGTLDAQPFAVRPVVVAGQPAPGGGTFDHFSVESLPVLAPVNGRGQVAFFAALARAAAGEGFFLASAGRIAKVALAGDRVPGIGTLSGFGKHPIPALNEAGAVAFAAAVAGGKTVEGIFLAAGGTLRAIALSGEAAPGIPTGTLASLDAPALNDRGDAAFLATVRRGRETLDAIYLRSKGKLRKVVAQGDPAPAGGSFAGFGAPVLNNRGVVAFAAAVDGPAVPGGIFVAHGEQIRMVVDAGGDTPIGGIFAKFAERLSLNDANAVAFNALLNGAPAAGAVFVAEDNRVRKVAALGETAPGGGRFSYFGLWPSLDHAGAVAFTASVDGGPSPVGVFLAGQAGTVRVAGVGDTLPGIGRLASLTLYPVAAMSPAGAVTFAAAPTATGEGVEGIFSASVGH